MQAILRNWTIVRIIRLILGGVALVYGIGVSDPLLIVVGAVVTVMAIFNAGCSPFASNCTIDPKKDNE